VPDKPISDCHQWRGQRRLQAVPKCWPTLDQQLWTEATREVDLFGEPGAASGWSKATRRNVVKSYGRWLTFLEAEQMLEASEKPLVRVTLDRLQAYIAALRQTCEWTSVHSYLHGLAMMLEALAPKHDTAWLWAIVSKHRPRTTPSTRKRGRIMHSSDLLAYGTELMDQAERLSQRDQLAGATMFCDGLMIATLSARPLRLRNFSAIEVDKQLFREGKIIYLRFEPHETKTGSSLEFIFPEALTDHLMSYLHTHRPVLEQEYGRDRRSRQGKEPGAALWITSWGTRMSTSTLHARIVDRTRQKFGVSVCPHLFRDCAASSLDIRDPWLTSSVVAILGHSAIVTSERYYRHSQMPLAARLVQEAITARRRDIAKQSIKRLTNEAIANRTG
jgi:integrase/recombinase XerD